MKKITAFFGFIVASIILYALLTYTLLPFAEPWIKNVYMIKHHITNMTKTSRIIVAGGSSTLFGFNGELVEKYSKYNFLNLGSHAGLPINYHLDQILATVKKGDIVFLPLEFTYYYKTAPYQESWYIQNMLFWDKDYNKYITPTGILYSLLTTRPTELIKAIPKHLKQQDKSPLEKWQKGETTSDTYSFLNLDKYGDFCFNRRSSYSNNPKYIDNNQNISEFFIKEFLQTKEKLNKKSVKIFLIYPPTIKNPNFNLDKDDAIKRIDHLKNELKKYNIEILGDPRDFHFDRELFFDTEYHLNCNGAKQRSLNFLKLLESLRLSNPQNS